MISYLFNIQLYTVRAHLQRSVDYAPAEARVVYEIELADVLDHPHHLLAGVRTGVKIEEVHAALESPFEQSARVSADETRHVILAYVERTGIRRAQADRESAAAVEQDLRHIVACVAHGNTARVFLFEDEFVRRLLEQLLVVMYMFQILHGTVSPFKKTIPLLYRNYTLRLLPAQLKNRRKDGGPVSNFRYRHTSVFHARHPRAGIPFRHLSRPCQSCGISGKIWIYAVVSPLR